MCKISDFSLNLNYRDINMSLTDEDIYQATVQYQHEFNFPELGRIPIQDCRQTNLYQLLAQSPDFANIPLIFLLVYFSDF